MILARMKSLGIHEWLTGSTAKWSRNTFLQNQNDKIKVLINFSKDSANLHNMATFFFGAVFAVSLPNDFRTARHQSWTY